jgi:hypothetical protein
MKMSAVKAKLRVWTCINISSYFPGLLTDLADIRYNISQENAVEHERFV